MDISTFMKSSSYVFNKLIKIHYASKYVMPHVLTVKYWAEDTVIKTGLPEGTGKLLDLQNSIHNL